MGSATAQRLISLAATFCLILIKAIPGNSSPTAYEVLEGYNFPVGLLPKGVSSYDLNATTGQFSAYLNDSCSFRQASYQLKYKPAIKGYISNGKLSSLEGISVKVVFMWMDIKEIIRSGDNLDFSVGVGKTGFPVDYFEDSPQCGCGLNCGRRQARKLGINPFALSW
ncbi:hypothetical protein AAG906_006349 [Vitis piasezkii]